MMTARPDTPLGAKGACFANTQIATAYSALPARSYKISTASVRQRRPGPFFATGIRFPPISAFGPAEGPAIT